MVDYIEGIIQIEKLLRQLRDSLLHKDYENARELCDKIIVELRLTKAQIGAQQI